MGLISRSKTIIKPFVNFKYWMNYDEHKNTLQGLSAWIAALLYPTHDVGQDETFEQAVTRLSLSKGQIEIRQRQCLMIALSFFCASLCSMFYTAFLLYNHEYAASFLGIGVSGLLFAYAFRYHFWYFQIKNRQLGCSLKDWWGSKVKG